MNLKVLFLGTTIGLVSGYIVKEIISKKIKITPEKVLEQVKTHFKKQGPIQGSWIHMEIGPFEKEQIHYQVYKGGISRQINGTSKQYEFVADSSTGTILEVRPLPVL